MSLSPCNSTLTCWGPPWVLWISSEVPPRRLSIPHHSLGLVLLWVPTVATLPSFILPKIGSPSPCPLQWLFPLYVSILGPSLTWGVDSNNPPRTFPFPLLSPRSYGLVPSVTLLKLSTRWESHSAPCCIWSIVVLVYLEHIWCAMVFPMASLSELPISTRCLLPEPSPSVLDLSALALCDTWVYRYRLNWPRKLSLFLLYSPRGNSFAYLEYFA